MGQHCVDCVGEASATTRAPDTGAVALDARQRTPIVTYTLIALNAVIFAVCAVQAQSLTDLRYSSWMGYGALISGHGFDNEYWRLLTSGFLHWSVIHVAVNMFTLYIIGADLERIFGSARYIAVYLIGLVGGSAFVMAFEHDNTATAGASGALYGLMGALLVVVLRIKAPPGTVIAMIVINLVISVTIPGISLLGHLGGLVFGAAAAAGLLWAPAVLLPPERRTYQRVTRVGWLCLAALFVIALALGTGFAFSDSMG